MSESEDSKEIPAQPVDNETLFAMRVTGRLKHNDKTLKRVDISAKLFRLIIGPSLLSTFHKQNSVQANSMTNNMVSVKMDQFLWALGHNTTVTTVHLSGTDLEDYLTEAQITQIFVSLSQMQQLRELFVFRGNCVAVHETNLATTLNGATNIQVLMMWEFGTLGDHPNFAAALRCHPSLQRITLTLPGGMPYGYLDVYVGKRAPFRALMGGLF
jgi:hypothetical protein